MLHNHKIRAYGCSIKHSDERKKFKVIRYCCWQSEVLHRLIHCIILLSEWKQKHPVFITNCLNEIHLHSKFGEWNFVPWNKNPADLCTRPNCIKQIPEKNLWKNGHTFLYSDEYFIPTETVLIEYGGLTCNVNFSVKNKSFEYCFKWTQFSSFYKLVKTVSWVLKIKQTWTNKVISKNKVKANCTNLTTSDISEAKRDIFKHAQKKMFPTEYKNLPANCYRCNHLYQTSSFVLVADYPTPIYHFTVSTK